MNSFYDEAENIFLDLLTKLEEERKSSRSGDQIQTETIHETFLRLIGFADNTSDNNLLSSLLRVQTQAVSTQLNNLNSTLSSFRNRLDKYNKTQTKIKLNRIKKLIDKPNNPINSKDLIKDTPQQTKQEIIKKFKELKDKGDLKGIIQQEISANNALTSSIDAIAIAIPEEIEGLRSHLISLIRAMNKEAYQNIYKLTTMQDELTKEVEKLENIDKILFEGYNAFGNSNSVLSLLNILNVLIFITDRKQIAYHCAQCKYYSQGKNLACIYAGQGKASLTKLITAITKDKKEIPGQLTKADYSCKEVWGLSTNDHYTPSKELIDSILKLLKGK